MGLIYKHTNIDNNKTYVGQTYRTMEERWDEHLYDSSRSEKYDYKFYRALRKYGPDCWTHEVIAEYDDEILGEAETYWISYLDTFHNGYNSTTGGDSYIMSEETKIKIRENHADFSGENHPRFGKHHSEESREKISLNHADMSGENNPFFGRVHNEYTKQKISKGNSGRNPSPEARKKMSDAQTKRWKLIRESQISAQV